MFKGFFAFFTRKPKKSVPKVVAQNLDVLKKVQSMKVTGQNTVRIYVQKPFVTDVVGVTRQVFGKGKYVLLREAFTGNAILYLVQNGEMKISLDFLNYRISTGHVVVTSTHSGGK